MKPYTTGTHYRPYGVSGYEAATLPRGHLGAYHGEDVNVGPAYYAEQSADVIPLLPGEYPLPDQSLGQFGMVGGAIGQGAEVARDIWGQHQQHQLAKKQISAQKAIGMAEAGARAAEAQAARERGYGGGGIPTWAYGVGAVLAAIAAAAALKG